MPDLRFQASTPLEALGSWAPIKALLPVIVVLVVAPFLFLLFKNTWKALDEEARAAALKRTQSDYRPALALLIVALTLTVHEYYGGRSFYRAAIEPILRQLSTQGAAWIQAEKFDRLYGYIWWASARILGYVAIPLALWKIFFPQDSLAEMGLRLKGFTSHLWIYGICLAAVSSALFFVAQQPEFLNYYPFYKLASRSLFDLLVWESFYFAQFFALEFFFRGWLLAALRRSFGSGAIFVMAVPYCMIHYGKPYLEAHGAILAGVALGSLAMKTRSIYSGFFLHITVAGAMDFIALTSRAEFPRQFWP